MNRAEQRLARIEGLVDEEALSRASLMAIGLGSMGNPVLDQLARHGVGREGALILADGDHVEARNLIGTTYSQDFVGMQKTEAMRDLILAIEPEMASRISLVPKMVTEDDIPWIREVAQQLDLLCLFADDFQVMMGIADAVHEMCPCVFGGFGERCDYAEIGFSVPNQTPPLSVTMGKRRREKIDSARAFGFDTAFVASYVASLCCGLLLRGTNGSELCVPVHVDAPLHILGLRKSWLFSQLPEDLTRASFIVGVPVSR